MDHKPNTAEPQKPRRSWFQFRLRTLLVGVAIASVACAYVGWQAKIVRERKALKQRIEKIGGSFQAIDPSWGHSGMRNFELPREDVPLVRRWLGDEGINFIVLPARTPSEDLEEVRRLFPSAWAIMNADGR